MNEDQDQLLVSVADEIAKHYSMTGSELLAYLAMGDRPHPDAPLSECGMIDPRSADESGFCRRPRGHVGNHASGLLDEDWPELIPENDVWPFWWTSLGGNTPAERKARGE